ncbi:hypothetical protein [Desulfosporosinus sp. BG]|uniref:hypothetical protein n=1 Tax=Desulfosporosinus sp. BG TaxID=1633135 RepID=UPI00085830A0|nr:hypothetical protein [Desulfosporosinus sp. BG]ODA40877.1 hypothetical protein DSBG_2318 [Desulfosporosinus sp. BG]
MMSMIQNELGVNATDCSLGILIMEGVQNTACGNRLAAIKHDLEHSLREKYGHATRGELKALHPIDTYVLYYKKFGHTYHVLPQLESVIKGKAIQDGLPLVEAMFLAELKNMLLTAGHDFDQIKSPLRFIVSTGQESYASLNGRDVTTIDGDIMISDQLGIISSILRGPDLRTAITEQTSRVIYTVYAPSGVEEQVIYQHLNDIESYVLECSVKAVTCFKHVFQE